MSAHSWTIDFSCPVLDSNPQIVTYCCRVCGEFGTGYGVTYFDDGRTMPATRPEPGECAPTPRPSGPKAAKAHGNAVPERDHESGGHA